MLFVSAVFAQKPHHSGIDLSKGEILYKQNCSSCHGINKKKLGPSLPDSAGLAMDKIDPTWILKWIRNSQTLIENHDTAALRVYKEYNQVNMPSFPQLTEDDIHSIGAYTMSESKRLDSLQKIEDINKAVDVATTEISDPTNLQSYLTITHVIIFVVAFLIFIIIIFMLKVFRVITFQLQKDETELRRLRKLSQEHKSRKDHENNNL